MQAYLQAIINLDMYIKRGGHKKKDRNELQSLGLQNHQYARSSSTDLLDRRYVGQHRIILQKTE